MSDDLDRTYSVHPCDHGVYVLGKYCSTDDVSALLKVWNYRGLKYLARDVAAKLGALVAVCESTGDAALWLAELEAGK
jgi:hypothetical protein